MSSAACKSCAVFSNLDRPIDFLLVFLTDRRTIRWKVGGRFCYWGQRIALSRKERPGARRPSQRRHAAYGKVFNEVIMTSNTELQTRRQQAVASGVASIHARIFPARAQNAEVWDVEGKRYIDFAGGIAVLNTGHRHSQVIAAVREQLERFSHTAFQVLPYEPYVALAERLNELAPGDAPKKTLLLTTGAEAIENAVKVARAYTKRPGVIAFGGAFHGRTLFALGLTGKVEPYKTGFGPFPGDIYHVPFPNPLHGVTIEDSLHALEALFKADVEPARVAAIVIEPVQGEGGFYIAPPEFL